MFFGKRRLPACRSRRDLHVGGIFFEIRVEKRRNSRRTHRFSEKTRGLPTKKSLDFLAACLQGLFFL